MNAFPLNPLRWLVGVSLLTATLPSLAQAVNQNQVPGQAAGQATPVNPTRNATQDSPNNKPTSASGAPVRLSPVAPNAAPAKLFARPRIGLAMGGGGALGLTEIGTLQWFEEHHIPIDVIAGTSMGCMVSALYSSGRTPDELQHVMNDTVFQSVFSFSNAYTSRSFRRREESRELPNGVKLGLKHKLSLRNALLTDQGLDAFLERQFLRYDDQTDFNRMPIPLRCVATDLDEAEPAIFARGSLPDAVRASVSIPGVFTPFVLNGHQYVDGVVTENLPTPALQAMNADVVLAVSIPLAPLGPADTDSLLGVLGRAAAIATNVTEVRLRKDAAVVMIPNIDGLGVGDYLKAPEMARRGYAAAEAHKAELLKYAVSDAEWQAYLAHRKALIPGAPGPILRVRVQAPTRSATNQVQQIFAPLVNHPVDTAKIEALLDKIRADGRYQANYTVGYESEQVFAAQNTGQQAAPTDAIAVPVATSTEQLQAQEAAAKKPAQEDKSDKNRTPAQGQQPESVVAKPGAAGLSNTQQLSAESLANVALRPVIRVRIEDNSTGPPYATVGANLKAQTGGITSATAEVILLDQDLGSYGAELRSHIRLGYATELSTEYFRPFFVSPGKAFFIAPRGTIERQPFPVFDNSPKNGAGLRVAERQLQTLSIGGDVGLTNEHTQELRAGFDFTDIHWMQQIGADGQPDLFGTAERARLRYSFDTADRALIPQFGLHLITEAGYRFNQVASSNAPEFTGQAVYSHRFALRQQGKITDPARPASQAGSKPNAGELFAVAVDGGSLFGRNIAKPFQYTLGGPLHLSASTLDQYRGTDYVLIQPALLKRFAQLPAPLGQSAYLGAVYEFAHITGPGQPAITRQDIFFGLVAETPLGVLTFGPALGTNQERKLIFTLGKLF